MRLLNQFAVVFVAVVFSVSCTRGSNKATAVSLKFDASQYATKQSSNLAVVVINVTGGNLKEPRLFNWDRHSCNTPSCPTPTEFEVKDIPVGGQVLVQVLAVFEDDDTEALTFKYADANKAIVSGSNEITVTPVAIGGATTEAHVYGRYLNQIVSSTPTGPTGILEAKFKPPASASVKADPPALTIMRGPIFAGWMSLFALDGSAKFDYFLDGNKIFSDLNIASLQSLTNGSFMMVDVPDYERPRWDNGPATYQIEKSQKIFVGYLGPQATGKLACFKDVDGETIPDAFVAGSAGANPLTWDSTINASTSSKVALQAGGTPFTPGDASLCDTSATDFSDHLFFNHKGLRNGHDSVAMFRGPFRAVSSYGDFVNGFSSNNSGLAVEFSLLPGVANASGVTGIKVMTRLTPAGGGDSGLYGSGDGIQCSQLGNVGFSVLGEASVNPGATSLRLTYSNFSPAGHDIVICPVLFNGKLADSGVKVESVRQPAVFKVIGSNTTVSDIQGPGIFSGMQLLKSAFNNNFHNVAFQIQNRFPSASEVDSAYVSADDGAWQPVSTSSASMSGVSLALIPVNSSNTGLSSVLSSSASVNLRFKVKLSSLGISNFGAENSEIVSEPLRLIGSADCSTPGSLAAYDVEALAPLSAGNILNVGTTANHRRFQMRWQGCSSPNWAAAVLDYKTVSGSASPANCFGSPDISRPTALDILIDPQDMSGVDCDISSLSVYFRSPSNAGVDNILASGSSTITHSLDVEHLALVPAATSIASLGDINYFYDLALVGPSTNFKANAFQLNQDKKLVSSTSVASGSTVWSTIAGWLTAVPGTGQLLSFVTNAAITAAPIREMKATDGTKTGKLAYGVYSGDNVIAVSEQSLDGGSAIMLIDNGTKIQLAYVPSAANDGFVNQSRVVFPLPIPDFTGATLGFVQKIESSGQRNVFVAVQNGTTSYYAYGRIVGSGPQMSVDWAPLSTKTSSQLIDVKMSYNYAIAHPLIAVREGANDWLINMTPPSKTSSWSGATLNDVLSINLTAASYPDLIGIGTCNADVYFVNRDGSNYFKLGQWDIMGNTPSSLASAGVNIAGLTKVECMPIGPSGAARLIMVYAPGGSAYSFAIEGAFPECDASANIALSLSATLPVPTSGGFRRIFPTNTGMNFVYNNGGKTVVRSVTATCGSGSATFNASTSGKTTAELEAVPSSINGAAAFTGNGPAGLTVFGSNSQYYQLRSR